jgi:hypothetical protein
MNGPFLCPSAQPDMQDASAFGVVLRDSGQPRVAYLKPDATIPLDDPVRWRGVHPLQVVRIAARCEELKCQHFNGATCSLGRRVATQLPPVVDDLPPCRVRTRCRWFAEQGAAVCRRCPQVTTLATTETPELLSIAPTPQAT